MKTRPQRSPRARLVRRILIFAAIGFVVLAALAGAYARFIEPEMLEMRREEYSSSKADRDFTLVFFTDSQFSDMYPERQAGRIADAVNAAAPDVLLFGGDFLDNYERDADSLDLDYIIEQFAAMEAPYGKFAVWGNHEYYGLEPYYGDFMEKAGFRVLVNEAVVIDGLGLCVAGAAYRSKGPRVPDMPDDTFNVLLMHHPLYAEKVTDGRADLMLAGHTHGGQVFFNITNKYNKGFYTVNGIDLYVGAGLGLSLAPFRFGVPPEITVFDIRGGGD